MNDQLSSITVSGKSTVYITPDEALLSFSIITCHDQLSKARTENTSISKNILSFLTDENVDEKCAQAKHIKIGENYINDKNPNNEKKYQATQNINVCITDFTRLDNIIDGLFAFEIANLKGPSFRSTKLEKAKDSAIRNALTTAKIKAENMAKVYGKSTGRPLKIEEIQEDHQTLRIDRETRNTSMEDSPSEPSFADGQIEISAQVSVQFIIE